MTWRWTRALLLGGGALELLTLLITSSFALDRDVGVRVTLISREAKKKSLILAVLQHSE